jgi:hypothetical protein
LLLLPNLPLICLNKQQRTKNIDKWTLFFSHIGYCSMNKFPHSPAGECGKGQEIKNYYLIERTWHGVQIINRMVKDRL